MSLWMPNVLSAYQYRMSLPLVLSFRGIVSVSFKRLTIWDNFAQSSLPGFFTHFIRNEILGSMSGLALLAKYNAFATHKWKINHCNLLSLLHSSFTAKRFLGAAAICDLLLHFFTSTKPSLNSVYLTMEMWTSPACGKSIVIPR